jgi:uncharacterized DUF497 family protein
MEYDYNFNHQKNRNLIESRGISFEEVIAVLKNKGPLDTIEHPNRQKYAHQKVYVVEILGYIYMVPFVEGKGEIFLKTIFPHRKATKKYLGKGDGNHD